MYHVLISIYCFLTIFFQCKGQVEVLLHKEKVNIIELENLNTAARECNISVSPDGKKLYFMSTRQTSVSFGDGDLYVTEIKDDGSCFDPRILGSGVNSMFGEDEPSITSDGKFMIFQSWKNGWEFNGGPYYIAENKLGVWSKGKGLGGGINQFFRKNFNAHQGFATDGMAVSPSGNVFIVACGENYFGNMDLYYSVKEDGTWSYLKKMKVSTKGDERSVYIAADGKTIYFSSNGYGGFGGMDLFKTSFEHGNTGDIINIGEPFNTSKDDLGFVIAKSGNAAYLVRDLNIFYADLTSMNAKMKPVEVWVEEKKNSETSGIIENTEKSILTSIKALDSSHLQKEKKLFIYFDFDSSSLTPESEMDLSELLSEITDKNISIYLEGHTDNIGNKVYNQKLSNARSKSVFDWFQRNGLEVASFKGFGEVYPVDVNESPEGRAKNRRVEITIRQK